MALISFFWKIKYIKKWISINKNIKEIYYNIYNERCGEDDAKKIHVVISHFDGDTDNNDISTFVGRSIESGFDNNNNKAIIKHSFHHHIKYDSIDDISINNATKKAIKWAKKMDADFLIWGKYLNFNNKNFDLRIIYKGHDTFTDEYFGAINVDINNLDDTTKQFIQYKISKAFNIFADDLYHDYINFPLHTNRHRIKTVVDTHISLLCDKENYNIFGLEQKDKWRENIVTLTSHIIDREGFEEYNSVLISNSRYIYENSNNDRHGENGLNLVEAHFLVGMVTQEDIKIIYDTYCAFEDFYTRKSLSIKIQASLLLLEGLRLRYEDVSLSMSELEEFLKKIKKILPSIYYKNISGEKRINSNMFGDSKETDINIICYDIAEDIVLISRNLNITSYKTRAELLLSFYRFIKLDIDSDLDEYENIYKLLDSADDWLDRHKNISKTGFKLDYVERQAIIRGDVSLNLARRIYNKKAINKRMNDLSLLNKPLDHVAKNNPDIKLTFRAGYTNSLIRKKEDHKKDFIDAYEDGINSYDNTLKKYCNIINKDNTPLTWVRIVLEKATSLSEASPYIDLGNHSAQKALNIAKEAESTLFRSIDPKKSPKAWSNCQRSLGYCFLMYGEYEKSYEYYKASFTTLDVKLYPSSWIHSKSRAAYCLAKIADKTHDKKSIKKAMKYHNDIENEINDILLFDDDFQHNNGFIYMISSIHIDEDKEKHIMKSEASLLLSLAINQSSGDRMSLHIVEKTLERLEKIKEDYQNKSSH